MALEGVAGTIARDAASSSRHGLQGLPEAFAGEMAALAREIGSRAGLEKLLGKTEQHGASSGGSTASDMMPASSVITNALSGLMQSSGGMTEPSGTDADPADTGTTAAVPGASSGSGSPGDLSPDDTQTLLQGDYSATQPPSSSITCPPNVSMDQLMNADGGLLSKMGNQTLTGKGAEGISGGLRDNLARLAGGQPGDIGTNRDVTMRALMILESVKNIPGSDGKQLPDSVRHNGNLSGLTPSREADNGSDVGYLQNLYKNSSYTLPAHRAASEGMKSDDTEESGAEIVGKKIGKIFKDIGIGLAMGLVALIPGVGEAADLGLGAAIGIGEGAADAAAAGGEAAAEGAAEAGGETAAEGGSEVAGDNAGEGAAAGKPTAAGSGAAPAEGRLGEQTLNDLLGSDKFGSMTFDDLVNAMKTVKKGTDLAHKLDDIYQDVVNAQPGSGNQNSLANGSPGMEAA